MGLKSFLKEKGFIEDGPTDKPKPTAAEGSSTDVVSPSYFPVAPVAEAGNTASSDPSFVVASAQAAGNSKTQVDPSFIKFFEDELTKSNLPGPDYFEFRQLLLKTQQKMATKGMTAPAVVLQAVLTSFEAQDIPRSRLIEAAKHYKDVLKKKNDDFIKGAETEKNNQLQKRQAVLQGHDAAIQNIQQQLLQLEQQRKQLEDNMNKEKTQLEVDKTLGKEGIEKIERAERMITIAHDYMQSTIDADIRQLQSV
jgi:hypothetical protein